MVTVTAAKVCKRLDLSTDDISDADVLDFVDEAAAKSVEEAKELIESAFEYVCDIGGVKPFRKRKVNYTIK